MNAETHFEAALAAMPVIGIVRASRGVVTPAVAALLEGGLRLVEVTLTTPGALDVIRAASEISGPASPIGAGSVRRPDEAKAAIDAGARFLVTPNLSPDVLATAADAGIPVVCGAFTPTEIHEASDRGATLVKVFPATGLGPSYLREVRAPMPEARLVPTGGVHAGNIGDWFEAGATAVALGSALMSTADVVEQRWAEVRERAVAVVAAAAAGYRDALA